MTRSSAPAGDPGSEVLQRAATAFGLLASTMRLHIVWILAQGECDVSGLAEQVGGTLPAISQHLSKLKLAGLVRARREGRRQVYLVDDPAVVTVVRLMVGQLADEQAGRGAYPGPPGRRMAAGQSGPPASDGSRHPRVRSV